MTNFIRTAMLLLLAQSSFCQSAVDQDTATVNRSLYTGNFETVVLEAGVTIPLGQMRQHMNTAPNLAFWVRQKGQQETVINYGMIMNFPAQRRFTYAGSSETGLTRSFSGMLGLQFDKILPIASKRHIDMEWGTAFGYAFHFYDDLRARAEYASLPKSVKELDEEPTFIKPFSSIFLGQAIKLRIRDFGVHARYNFTPFSAFQKTIDSSFGAHSLTVGVFYRQ